MIKSIYSKTFLVWQTYQGSKKQTIETDTSFSAAQCYAENNCLTSETSVYFISQHSNNTKHYHNQEIGSIFVTEKR